MFNPFEPLPFSVTPDTRGFGHDREGAPQAVVAWGLFRIPKGLKCVERREAGRGAGVDAPKPSSHSGRIVGDSTKSRLCSTMKQLRRVSKYTEIRIGTQPDGKFEITGVPVPENWYVYAEMQSVATRGATGSVACTTKRDDEVVYVGDLPLKPAYHLRGRVVLSEDQPIVNGMKVTIKSEKGFDFQTATRSPTGRFEFVGLAARATTQSGHPSSDKDGRVFTYTPPPPPVPIEHDLDNFVINLHPDASASAKPVAASKPAPR